MPNRKAIIFLSFALLVGLVSVFLMKTISSPKTVQELLVQIKKDGFSGGVLIAKGETVLYEKGFGSASCDPSVVNTNNTVFAIGSITKMFTDIAIAQLDAEGRLNIDALISDYLDNVPVDKADITTRQLLEHTSGISAYHETSDLGDFEVMNKDEAFKEIMRRPLVSAPGEKERYSNSGYTLLAMLIEATSGLDYTRYLKDNILSPAGMTATGFWGDHFEPMASTPTDTQGCGSPDQWQYSWVLVGNGGMVSTTRDILLWIRALKGDSLINASAKQRIRYNKMLNEGFGSAGGSSQHEFNATIEYDAQQDLTVIVLSNRNTVSAESIALKLLQALIGDSDLKKQFEMN